MSLYQSTAQTKAKCKAGPSSHIKLGKVCTTWVFYCYWAAKSAYYAEPLSPGVEQIFTELAELLCSSLPGSSLTSRLLPEFLLAFFLSVFFLSFFPHQPCFLPASTYSRWLIPHFWYDILSRIALRHHFRPFFPSVYCFHFFFFLHLAFPVAILLFIFGPLVVFLLLCLIPHYLCVIPAIYCHWGYLSLILLHVVCTFFFIRHLCLI